MIDQPSRVVLRKKVHGRPTTPHGASAAQFTGSARIGKELRALGTVLAVRFPNLPGRRELHEAVVVLG